MPSIVNRLPIWRERLSGRHRSARHLPLVSRTPLLCHPEPQLAPSQSCARLRLSGTRRGLRPSPGVRSSTADPRRTRRAGAARATRRRIGPEPAHGFRSHRVHERGDHLPQQIQRRAVQCCSNSSVSSISCGAAIAVILSANSLVSAHQDHAVVAASHHDATPLTSGPVHHLRGRSRSGSRPLGWCSSATRSLRYRSCRDELGCGHLRCRDVGEEGHGGLAEVAAVGGLPFVVCLDQDRAGQPE